MSTAAPSSRPIPASKAALLAALPKGRPRKPPPIPAWWLDLAQLLAYGHSYSEAQRRLGKSLTAIRNAVASPRFADVLARAEQTASRETETLLALARPAAVKALRAILDASPVGDSGVDVKARLEAARAVLGASGPPTARQREAAEQDVLKRVARVDSELAAKVADALQGESDAAYAALSDDELYRIVRGEQ